MPPREVSFSKEYWTRVFEPTLEGYIDGVTPNPDVMCNREIKFDPLMDAILGMEARTLATGHYARLSHNPTRLLRAVKKIANPTPPLCSPFIPKMHETCLVLCLASCQRNCVDIGASCQITTLERAA